MSKRKDECVVPGCHNKRYCRGDCIACYSEARRKIAAGEATDEELVRKKLWLKANRSGRPSKNRLSKVLAAK